MEKTRLFAVARSIAGVSVEEFADRNGVGRRAIYQALQNPKTSKRLVKAIDAFISTWCPKTLQGPGGFKRRAA
jgi:hypothetical protein